MSKKSKEAVPSGWQFNTGSGEEKFTITGPEQLGKGEHLHFTLKVASPVDASVVDRHDLEAEAVYDPEGWAVIIIRNVVGVPVAITPLESLKVVIVPRRAK